MTVEHERQDEQDRQTARRILDAYKEQARAEAAPASRWHASAPAWIACVLSILAVLWQAATTSSQVNEHDRRIESMETRMIAQEVNDRLVIERLARIEAKVDVITGTSK